MIKHFLAFEKQIADLEGKIEELRHLSSGSDINIAEEIGKLQASVSEKLKSTYSQLSPWQKVQVARHSLRPHTYDYIKNIFEDYIPLHGDKNYADDSAIIGGFAKINNISVCLTPEQFHNYENKNAIVVIIDLLRATTVISTAFENGVKSAV